MLALPLYFSDLQDSSRREQLEVVPVLVGGSLSLEKDCETVETHCNAGAILFP